MRDIALALVLAFFVLWSLRKPWIGIMLWVVVSILNPHTYSYILSTMPVAAIVAIATMLSLVISSDRKAFPFSPETILLLALMLWFCVTLTTAIDYENSLEQWKKVMKIDLMLLITLAVLHQRKHIVGLVWALAISIGFYSVKGGLFTLATGGNFLVWGPTGTYIQGNNELALAVIITIPLAQFLRSIASKPWQKRLILGCMLLSAVAALGSHSRGALIALVAMALVLWLHSKNKLMSGVAIGLIGAVALGFMPSEWMERMRTIGEYREDGSAMGRINAWWMTWNLAKSHFFGGGFDIYSPSNFALYAPIPDDVHVAHSIYFQMLGEHGFVGLGLSLAFWLVTYRSAGRLRKRAALLPQTRWLAELGAMCQVSIVGFAVGGAFLSLAYFDLPYNLMVLVVLGNRWIDEQAWRNEPALTAEAKPDPVVVASAAQSSLSGRPARPLQPHRPMGS